MKITFLSLCIIVCSLKINAQKNIFEENFKNNKNKWSLLSSVNKDSATLNIMEERLLIDNKQKGAALSLINIPNKKININADDEVTISATLKHISGSNLFGYGILIGEKLPDDKFNGYCFSILDTGYYRMYVAKNGKQIVYKDWTASDVINKNNAENKLTIIKKRNQFHFLINGQWLFYISNDNININSVGVINTAKQKVAYDNINIESFTKINDKKEQDKINDLSTILQQSQNQFINAYALKTYDQKKVTWLPYINEENKNETILFQSGYTDGIYEDNWSYTKTVAEGRVKQYTRYIEKVLAQFEKIEKPNVLGKKTFWLSKNPKYAAGTYVLLDEFNLSDNYYIKFVVAKDKNKTKEAIEKMKD